MNIKVEFAHKLTASDVRAMCIRYDFYTCGDNEDYSKMLDKCNTDEATPELIEELACDIVNHSDVDNNEFLVSSYESDNTYYDGVTTLLVGLLKTYLKYTEE